MRIRLSILALVLLVGLGMSSAAHAQSGKSVLVERRDAVITLQPNGDADFVETWVVNFQNGPFTFAFREIPTNNLRDIVIFQVSEGGEPLRVETSQTDSTTKFTWYFPATNQGVNYFSDVHTFTLHYTVRGAMRIYPKGDQFWWKFIESDRGYTIQSSKVLLKLPAAFATEDIKATTYTNSDETGGARIIDVGSDGTSSTVEFNGGPFPSATQWEIRAQFPHIITAEPEAWQVWQDEVDRIAAQNNLYAVVATVVLLIGAPLLLLLLWYLLGRDKPTTFQAEFLPTPPDDTPPGVVGTLLDERADLQDILATVADLAQRGYLQIKELDSFGTPEYKRTGGKKSDLAPFESRTLDALFHGDPKRDLSELRGSFYYMMPALEQMLYDEVVARGYFPTSPLATRDFYFKLAKWGALLVPLLGLPFYCVTFWIAPLLLIPLIALELVFIGLLGLSQGMPQRTAKGALAAAQWNAFKRYLASVSKYTNVGTAQEQFAKYLPYAIAFGLEKSWIETFSRVDTPAPTWYVPHTSSEEDWSWRDLNTDSSSSASSQRHTTSGLGTLSTGAPAQTSIFKDSPSDRAGANAPDLNSLAASSFVGLNRVSGNMFDFLNSSAAAFTEKEPSPSAVQSVGEGIGSFLSWVGSSSGSSGSSDSSWSSSSSSSSSSWSGGGSSGGGGGGGGSSGFG